MSFVRGRFLEGGAKFVYIGYLKVRERENSLR